MVILLQPVTMGRHKEWRKTAKKERRRRIRTLQAKRRDGVGETSPEYTKWLEEQEELERFEIEQIERKNKEEQQKWLDAEIVAMEQWRKLQEKKELLRQERLEQEARLKMEWELEQDRKRKEEERLKEIEVENKRRQEIFMKHLEEFLSGDSSEPPPELMVSRETKPECDLCPFFIKTACCRFGDQCSRNHRYPGISKVLLATNFYTHFGLENANFNEYDTDLMLEYEDNDTYKEFKDFFYDVLPEFEKFGRIIQFKVCNNYEKHLRGNTYIEFAELRCAVAAYRALHSRWYGGKQISLQFCNITSWKNAICGLQSRKRCPKGRACNFLHVFRNPNNFFNNYFNERIPRDSRSLQKTPLRSWRWSESPEVEVPRRRRSRSKDRRRRSKSRESNNKDSESISRTKSRGRDCSRHRRMRTRTRRSRSRSPKRSSERRRKDRSSS